MIDDAAIKLMAKIMQEGMTGYRIAELLNDANKKFDFCKDEILPPGQIQERKEVYARKWLNALKEKGWEQVLSYIANQLLDKTRVYFEEDKEHPYPQELLNRLKEKIEGVSKDKEKTKKRKAMHGKTIRTLLKGIEKKELVELLYQDIKDIDLCISVGAWKPALVLCGSVLEAILTDWIKTVDPEEIKRTFKELYPNKKNKKIEEFSLEELIDVAEKTGLLHGYHATISEGIRKFRNLIHPNFAIRQQIKPNKAIAEIGKQIIFAILQERRKIT